MSSDAHGEHDKNHAASASDPHGGHGHEAFDPEPARTLSAGEPRTPGWVSLLGGGIFLLGGVYFLSGQSSSDTPAAPSAPVLGSSRPVTLTPPTATAKATASGSNSPLTREQIMDLVNKQKGKFPMPGSSSAAPAKSGSASAAPPGSASGSAHPATSGSAHPATSGSAHPAASGSVRPGVQPSARATAVRPGLAPAPTGTTK